MASGGDSRQGFLEGGKPAAEARSPVPWIIAGAVVVLALVVLLVVGRHHEPANPGGAGLAPADPYAANLAVSNLKMSQASSVVGGQATYLDGQITNRGTKTVTSLTAQVAFRDFTNQILQKETMPVSLIRTHEPYVDTEPVASDPIGPGQTREFRLIFDRVAEDWNQQYPEIRMIRVTTR